MASKRLVIPVTDCLDLAYSEMRAAIIRFSGKISTAKFIEPLVGVAPFSIINANFAVRLMAEAYLEQSIIYTIVNPVISQPERIIGRTQKNNVIFAGRNNGAFSWLVKDWGCAELVELPDPGFIPFGGKMIYPKAIAQLLNGKNISSLGNPIPVEKIQHIDIPTGTIVHIDNFGIAKINLRVDFEKDYYAKEGDKFKLLLNGKYLYDALYIKRLMSAPDKTWAIYPGSSLGGLIEIGMTRDKASIVGNLNIGDKVSIEYIS